VRSPLGLGSRFEKGEKQTPYLAQSQNTPNGYGFNTKLGQMQNAMM